MDAFTAVSRSNLQAGFGQTFVRAIFAGWLIALMVWLLPAAEGSRPFIIVIVVGLGGFAHIIAGSAECAFLEQGGEASIGDFITVFFVPTLLGNVLGGVGVGRRAQLRSGGAGDRKIDVSPRRPDLALLGLHLIAGMRAKDTPPPACGVGTADPFRKGRRGVPSTCSQARTAGSYCR